MDSAQVRSGHTLGQFLTAALLFSGTMLVYAFTLCPTVSVGDSGEFIANSFVLGINHPTGYPLFTLIGRLANLLTGSASPAVAMNALSAIFTSLTVACVFFIIQLLVNRISVAAATALLFAFSHTLWSRATTAEVYPLVLLSAALAILFLLQWIRTNDYRFLLIVAYVTGLGLSQHVIGALVAVSLLFGIIAFRPKLFLSLRLVSAMLIVAVLGWTSYLYLFVRAGVHPPIVWGNPETLGGFIHHMIPLGRRGISSFFQAQEGNRWQWILEQVFTKEFWYFGIAALPGIYALRRRRPMLVLLLSIPLLNLLFTVNRNMPLHADLDAYLLPTHLAVAVLIGCGLSLAIESVAAKLPVPHYSFANKGIGASIFLLPLMLLYLHYEPNNRSRDFFGEDFATNLFNQVEPNALVFTKGDEQTFLAWYAKYVKRSHPQMTIVSLEFLRSSWAGAYLDREGLGGTFIRTESPEKIVRTLLNQNIGRRPIYFTHLLPWESLAGDYSTRNVGMMVQILPANSQIVFHPSGFTFHPLTASNLGDERCKLLSDYYPQQLAVNAQFWVNRNDLAAATSELNAFFALPLLKKNEDLATALLLRGIVSAKQRDVVGALRMADSALGVSPRDWRAFQYRGEFSLETGDTMRALKDWRRSLDLNPRNTLLQGMVSSLSRATGSTATKRRSR